MTSRRQRHAYGYQPQMLTEYQLKLAENNQLKQTEIALNTELDTKDFFYKYNEVVPDYWPKHADGHLARHLYLMIDDLSLLLKALPQLDDDKPLDFSDTEVKRLAIEHVRKCREGDMRPGSFLSTSLDLDALLSLTIMRIVRTIPRRPLLALT